MSLYLLTDIAQNALKFITSKPYIIFLCMVEKLKTKQDENLIRKVKFGPYIFPKLVMLQVYFFLYPFGHFGLIAVILLINFPFVQVILTFLFKTRSTFDAF
jgi:hypothetical protein